MKSQPIVIHLRGGLEQKHDQVLDEDFIKSIQHEYACKYLEQIGLVCTPQNIEYILEKAPLSSCDLIPGWNSSSWLADTVTINPLSLKKSFDHNRP